MVRGGNGWSGTFTFYTIAKVKETWSLNFKECWSPVKGLFKYATAKDGWSLVKGLFKRKHRDEVLNMETVTMNYELFKWKHEEMSFLMELQNMGGLY